MNTTVSTTTSRSDGEIEKQTSPELFYSRESKMKGLEGIAASVTTTETDSNFERKGDTLTDESEQFPIEMGDAVLLQNDTEEDSALISEIPTFVKEQEQIKNTSAPLSYISGDNGRVLPRRDGGVTAVHKHVESTASNNVAVIGTNSAQVVNSANKHGNDVLKLDTYGPAGQRSATDVGNRTKIKPGTTVPVGTSVKGLLDEHARLKWFLRCLKCFEKSRNILQLPCQHLLFCSECAKDKDTCPVENCGSKIVNRREIEREKRHCTFTDFE